jgi:hypothetical protein
MKMEELLAFGIPLLMLVSSCFSLPFLDFFILCLSLYYLTLFEKTKVVTARPLFYLFSRQSQHCTSRFSLSLTSRDFTFREN